MPAYLPKCSMFSIASLLALAAACGWCQPSFADAQADRVATALLRIDTGKPVILQDLRDETERVDHDVFRNTQINLVKSHFVLKAALRRQEVAEIPAIRSADDPLAWLRERLEVDFPGGGEVMRVRLADGGLADAGLTKVLDSVVEAFVREVVDAERNEKLRMKSVLEEQLEKNTRELTIRRAEYFELAGELGGLDTPAGKLQAEMLLERWRANREDRRELQNRLADAYLDYQLELIELGSFKLREEDPNSAEDDAGADGTDQDDSRPASPTANLVDVEVDDAIRERVDRARAKYAVLLSVHQARIQRLDQEAEALTHEIRQLSRQSAELAQRREELERNAQLIDRMAEKLALWDVELAAGPRVKVIQPAHIKPMDDNQQP